MKVIEYFIIFSISLLGFLLISKVHPNPHSNKLPPSTQIAPFSERLMDCICEVESGCDHSALGFSGEFGAYQIKEGCWNDMRERLSLRKDSRPIPEHSIGAFDPQISRIVAFEYLIWIKEVLIKWGVSNPDLNDLLIGYNWGVGNYRKVNFNQDEIPPYVKSYLGRVNICLGDE